MKNQWSLFSRSLTAARDTSSGKKLFIDKMRERDLSRRDFLKLSIASLAGGTAFYVSERLYPLLGLIFPEEGKIAPEQINIQTLGEISLGEGIKVNINKGLLQEALLYLASFEEPINGPGKIAAVLDKRPIEIGLDRKISRPKISAAQFSYPLANYTPFLSNGPKITFNRSFIDRYFHALQNVDLAAQIANDAVVFHEYYHFFQDLRNPVEQIITTGILESREWLNSIPFMPKFDPLEEALEKEAWDKAGEVTTRILNEHFSTGNLNTWPFGRFFNFS